MSTAGNSITRFAGGRRLVQKHYENFNLLNTTGTFKRKMMLASIIIAVETRQPEKLVM